ncbi:MAG: ketoacyl-ACP synthase III [Deltaproteobacteria bacterium]|nr:ketoacyl-ACP synthase III [Deltaproteobacteria bacterium]
MERACTIEGLGFHVPARIVTNAELETMVDTNDEWIVSRTGIRQRHVAGPGETCSELALEATRKALKNAGLVPEDLTHIILATFTPDAYIPSAACVLENKLGLKNLPAFDLYAACSGFLYALEAARAFCALHAEARILVVASEVVTSRTDFTDRSTCVLFGDGAGAAVVTNRAERGIRIRDVMLDADGSLGDLLTVRGGGSGWPPVMGQPVGRDYFVEMQGREVFRHAVRCMQALSEKILVRNGLNNDDIDLFIPHQANERIIHSLAKKLDFPEDRIMINVDRYGNCSAASIPIALAEAMEFGRFRDGDRLLLTSFGGGFTWASAILEA